MRSLKPKNKPNNVSRFPGLHVTVTPSVSRLWHMKCRIYGREKRLSFGAYPSVSLTPARKLRDAGQSRPCRRSRSL
ncbi:MAG: DUF4102 domain-containing protein [Natronohydrobacter sp.]|nr:DUF4102 domain-containing protein [Natronohydrobacter sp.]